MPIDRSALARVLAGAERCQREQSPIPRPAPLRWARAARVWARRERKEAKAAPVGLGPPSRFRTGDRVRVRSAAEIRATLDAHDKHRGMLWMPRQWECCGQTYTVQKVVRRMLDDSLQMRTISRAVALEGVTCDHPDGTPGCGQACTMLFKDEWLEPATETPADAALEALEERDRRPAEQQLLVRVKDATEIVQTLGRDGRLHGISPSPQMLALAGRRFRVARRREFPHGHRHENELPREWYILEGVRCDGSVLGSAGPCDRLCGLLWHESWLEFVGEERLRRAA